MGESVRFDRELLLGGSKRNDILSVEEVIGYGRDSYGDPSYVSLYGLKPKEWYARGLRILGRTAVECTRDRLAELIGRDIAAIARVAPYSARIIVDPFAGSANTLYWIQRHIPGSEAVGFELDDDVFETTRRNLSILGLDLELRHVDYQAGLETLTIGEQQLLIVFVAPPWGDALTEASGLEPEQDIPTYLRGRRPARGRVPPTAAAHRHPDVRDHRRDLAGSCDRTTRLGGDRDVHDQRAGAESRSPPWHHALDALGEIAGG